jgi:hypothetical protein
VLDGIVKDLLLIIFKFFDSASQVHWCPKSRDAMLTSSSIVNTSHEESSFKFGPLKATLTLRVEKSDTNHPVARYNVSEVYRILKKRCSSPPCLNVGIRRRCGPRISDVSF